MEKDTGSGFEMFILQTEKTCNVLPSKFHLQTEVIKMFFFSERKNYFLLSNTKVAEKVLLKIEAGQNPFLLKCKEKKQVRYKC